ncbi:hypothetical protein [Aristophania vespae]|uniref:hypothetical protein n=1 Tax=Aristophania vespae TaxID=2697033 RepID=UPI0023519D89|nr:hypothetical protein [Aristophania vespae]UMM63111.1 hypothetical protein DM15PD_00650 [Aristophania vespae]
MARIRSIHPGFWTEENIVTVSAFARLLYIGLWQQADDGGCFEWKPLKLKMTIFPGDNLTIEELLAELVTVGLIQDYEAEGRQYGAIRNFGKWQRPKKPARQFPMPDAIRAYCCTTELKAFLKGSIGDPEDRTSSSKEKKSIPVENQFSTSSELSPQMKEEGCRMKDNKIDKSILQTAPLFAPSEFIKNEIKLKMPSSSRKASSPRRMLTNHIHRVMSLTGRTKAGSASLLGAWMKTLQDDLEAFEQILSTAEAKNEAQELADPVAWVEMACLNSASDWKKHENKQKKQTPLEKTVHEALRKAQAAWSEMFKEHRDFGWVQEHWPERAHKLGLPPCVCTLEAYMAHYQSVGV